MASISIIATGKKMKMGAHAHSAGRIWPKNGSVAKSLDTKTTKKQLRVVRKLIRIAVFIAFGSRQTSTGSATISIIRLMMGSVMRVCF